MVAGGKGRGVWGRFPIWDAGRSCVSAGKARYNKGQKGKQYMRISIFVFLIVLLLPKILAAAPIDEGKVAWAHHDYRTAYKILQPLAQRGNTEAQRYVATMYLGAKGVKRDWKKAFIWLQRAAKKGDAGAQYDLSVLCGLPVASCNEEQRKIAKNALLRSANQGNAEAQYAIGYEYAKRFGEKDHLVESMKWYLKAADQGQPGAQGKLAARYLRGEGVSQDYEEAYFWSSLARNLGNTWGAAGAQAAAAEHLSVEQRNAVDKRVKNWKSNPTPATKSYPLVSDIPADATQPVY